MNQDEARSAANSMPPADGSRSRTGVQLSEYHKCYEGKPPWEIDRPQPAIIELFKQGKIQGTVLDVGAGTGENAIYLARHGLSVVGIDLVPVAIDRARAKARDRDVPVAFRVHSALELHALEQTFDTVIDSGLFHSFFDAERIRFVDGLRTLLRSGGMYFMICFSEHETREGGPRRVTQAEIRESFSTGWSVESIVPTRFETCSVFDGGAHVWLASIRRL